MILYVTASGGCYLFCYISCDWKREKQSWKSISSMNKKLFEKCIIYMIRILKLFNNNREKLWKSTVHNYELKFKLRFLKNNLKTLNGFLQLWTKTKMFEKRNYDTHEFNCCKCLWGSCWSWNWILVLPPILIQPPTVIQQPTALRRMGWSWLTGGYSQYR